MENSPGSPAACSEERRQKADKSSCRIRKKRMKKPHSRPAALQSRGVFVTESCAEGNQPTVLSHDPPELQEELEIKATTSLRRGWAVLLVQSCSQSQTRLPPEDRSALQKGVTVARNNKRPRPPVPARSRSPRGPSAQRCRELNELQSNRVYHHRTCFLCATAVRLGIRRMQKSSLI